MAPRPPRGFSRLLSLLLLLVAMSTYGCGGGGGGGGGGSTGAPAGSNPPAPTTATVEFQFDLANGRTVPADVTGLRFTGYDTQGNLVFGPVERPKAAQVVLTSVPVQVTSMRVEYLQGGTLVGVFAAEVELNPGQTQRFDDPAYEDLPPASLTRVEVSPGTASVPAGLTTSYTAVAVFADGFRQVVTDSAQWSTGDGSVASVSNVSGSRGTARGVAAGATTVSATYAGRTGSADLTVTAARLTSLSVTPPNVSLPEGRTQQYLATGTFTDGSTADVTADVVWSSSNTGRATVSNTAGTKGLATAVDPGAVTITANHAPTGISGSTGLTVTPAELVSLAVSPLAPSVAKGRTQQFTATATFSDSSTRDVTSTMNWTSSAPSIASVSNLTGTRGLASTHATGQAVITATDSVTSVSGSATLTVTPAVLTSIAVTPANPSVPLGLDQAFTATGTFSDGTTQVLTTTVTWSSSATSVATISNAPGTQGNASTKATGATTISALDSGSGISGSTTLTVSPARLVSLAVTPPTPSIAKGRTQQFTATGTYTDTTTRDVTTEVTWTSSSAATATISNAAGTKGLASGLEVGSTTITAAAPGTAITGTASLSVTPAVLVSLAVTPTNPSVPKGLTQQFTATGTFSDNSTQELTAQVTWSSSDTGKATVSNLDGSRGLASAAAVGATTITAVDPATQISGGTTLTVTDAVLSSVAVTPVNPSIAKGRTQQFTATGTFTDGTTSDLTTSVTWSSTNTTTATITSAGGLATGAATGTSTIRATHVASGLQGSTTLTVTAAVLDSLAVTPTNPSVAKGRTQQFTATGTFSDGTTSNLTGSVTWSSSNSGTASVSNANGSRGLATALAEGSTTIAATDVATGVTGGTTLTVTAAVLDSLAVTPTNPSVAKGRTQQFTATGTFSDGTTANLTTSVTWSSSDTGKATISNADGSRGLASALAQGTTTITARDAATNVSSSTVLTVTPAALVSLAVTPTNPSVAKGRTQQFTATGTFSDGSTSDVTGTVSWSSSQPATASVSNAAGSRGLATALAQGGTTITATDAASGVTGDTTLTVTPAVLDSVAVTPASPSLAKGRTLQFTATGTFSDGTTANLTGSATWTSSDTGKAGISNADGSRGLATALAQGPTTITATDVASGRSGSTTLTVTAAVLDSLAVTPTAPSVPKGRTQQFTATGTFSDGTTSDLTTSVTWSSSDTAKVAISNADGSRGLATGVGQGQATVTALDSATGVSGSTTLTVTPAVLASVAVTPTNPSVAKGRTQQFTATGTFSDGTTANLTGTVGWSSSDPAKATISNADGSRGLATALETGATTLTATDAGTGLSGSTTLTVTPAVLVSLAMAPKDPAVAKGRTQQFTATGTFSDGTTSNLTTSVTWSSSDSSKASISNADGSRGLATALAQGTTTITATDVPTGVTGSTTLTVTPAVLVSLSVSPAAPSVAKGRTQQFTATGTFSDASTADLTGTVTWTSSDPAKATISNAAGSRGLATTLAEGPTTITATDAGTAVTNSATLTVTPAVLASIAVSPANSSVTVGATKQFTATGTFTDGTTSDMTATVTWSSSNGSAATISNAEGSRGLATGVAEGATTVTATDPGTSVSGSTGLTVAPAPPPEITVQFTNKCGGTAIPAGVAGMQVRWTNQDTFEVVTGNLDANGRAVFTRQQITPGVAWEVKLVPGTSGCGSGSTRVGCWDGTHSAWGTASSTPTGEAAGIVRLYMACPGSCTQVPAPPYGYDAPWGNTQGCPGS